MVEGESRVPGVAQAGACVELDVDASIFGSLDSSSMLDAVYGAAVTFTDRCFVHLETLEDARIRVVLRPKPGRPFEAADLSRLASELRSELEDQAFRQAILETSRQAPPEAAVPASPSEINVDDLRSFEAGASSEERDAEDPLAIALRWEASHANRPGRPTGAT